MAKDWTQGDFAIKFTNTFEIRRARYPMSNVYSLEQFKKSKRGKTNKAIFFDKKEIGQLLNVYSRQVAQGIWKDYAIDQLPGLVVFSIFKNAHEHPIYTIVKQVHPSGKGREYLVHAGAKRLSKSDQLSNALRVLEKKTILA